MAELTGKEALEFAEQIARENKLRRAEALARGKADAAARGKEPFDLARLEKLCAIDALGTMGPDERRARLEEMYYVQYPDVLTLEEFARQVDQLGSW